MFAEKLMFEITKEMQVSFRLKTKFKFKRYSTS